jgi:hypothetical protein
MQIHRKKRKKGWELDPDNDRRRNNDYPAAMNALAQIRREGEEEDSDSESSDA